MDRERELENPALRNKVAGMCWITASSHEYDCTYLGYTKCERGDTKLVTITGLFCACKRNKFHKLKLYYSEIIPHFSWHCKSNPFRKFVRLKNFKSAGASLTKIPHLDRECSETGVGDGMDILTVSARGPVLKMGWIFQRNTK